MNYPFKSFFLAILIWGLLLFSLNRFFFFASEIVPVSLEIEAGEFDYELHEKQQSALQKNSTNAPRHDLSNSATKNKSSTKSIVAIENPLPVIPDELREEAFRSFAIARFYIDENGLVNNVELIKPCANPKLNQLLLKSLRKWRFNAINAATTKDITVSFEVI